jgi:hypothetical protein
MKPTTIIQPPRLARRPQFHGLPVPATAYVSPENVPDFRVTDPRKWEHVAKKSLCGLCGEPRGKVLWFIGGPKCVTYGLFYDPPMHLECLLYALQVCPFLAMAKTFASIEAVKARHASNPDIEIREDKNAATNLPERFYVFGTRRYSIKREANNVYLAPYKPHVIEVPNERESELFETWMRLMPVVEEKLLTDKILKV